MKNLSLFIPITKIDAENRLVYGIATAEQVDKSGEIMDYESTKPYYEKWSGEIHKASGGKSYGNVREMHSNIAAGKITQLKFNDPEKQIEICAKVVDESSWAKCLEGVLTGFSQGGSYVKTWADDGDPKVTRYTADPAEVSLVDNPCLGSATFELVRMVEGKAVSEMRKFKNIVETTVDGKPVQPAAEPEQVWKATDGKTFTKKDDWRLYQIALENKAVAAGLTAPVLGALEELEKAIKSKETAQDENRLSLLKDAKAAGDKATVAQKELLAEDMATQVALAKRSAAQERVTTELAKLKKGFEEAYDAQRAIEALCIIEGLISGEEWEAMWEGENEASQLADLKEAVTRLKTFIAAEIMEGEGDTAEKLAKAAGKHLKVATKHLGKAMEHHDDAETHGVNTGKAHDGMRKAMTCMADCMKTAGGELAKGMGEHLDKLEEHLGKAEKHHGKLGKAHDGLGAEHKDLGKALKAASNAADESDHEKVETGELKKSQDALATAQAALEESNKENAAMKKSLEELTAKVTVEMPKLIDRLNKLEAQPMPAKGALFDASVSKLAPVAKGHEGQDPATVPAEASTTRQARGLSPEEQRRLLGLA